MKLSEKIRHITESLSDVIWLIDIATRKFTYVSPSVCSLFEYSVEEVYDYAFLRNPYNDESFHRSQEEIIEAIRECVVNKRFGESKRFGHQIPTKTGKQMLVETEVRVLDKDGEPFEILGVTRNVEYRRESEKLQAKYHEDLQKLLEEKKNFIKVLAHDIKSPFGMLLGYTEVLKEDGNNLSDVDRADIYEILHKNISSTYNLLEDLLCWEQTQTGNPVICKTKIKWKDFCNSMRDRYFSNAKNINVTYDCSENIVLKTDINILKAILRNVISNAIKFSKVEGSVRIQTITDNGFVVVHVSDKGVGMSAAQIQQVMNLGADYSLNPTFDEKGSGYGLRMCQEYLRKLGGNLRIESVVGQGTDVFISVPIK